MIFIALTFIAALLIEGLGTLVSVIGLSTLFGSNPIIVALAVALDLGKLVVVALLYKYWHTLNGLMRTYGLIAATVTMIITSAGAAGYLSSEFQKAIVGTQEVALKVDLLKQEQTRLQQRKDQIDQQIASLPERFSASQRVRMINQFKAEQTTITTRLAEIDRELPTLKVNQINTEAKAGPILYIAKAFDISVEEAVKYVILMIIFVFDPLAVFLIVAGNFLLDQRRKKEAGSSTMLPMTKPLEVSRAADEPLYTELKPSPDFEDYISKTSRGSPAETLPVEDDKDDVMYSRELRGSVITDSKPIDSTDPVISNATMDQAVEKVVLEEGQPEVDSKLQGEIEQARRAGMSLEAWRAAQLAKLDRIQTEVNVLNQLVKPREEITYSALTGVRADNSTQIAQPQNAPFEVGYGTGVYTTGSKTK